MDRQTFMTSHVQAILLTQWEKGKVELKIHTNKQTNTPQITQLVQTTEQTTEQLVMTTTKNTKTASQTVGTTELITRELVRTSIFSTPSGCDHWSVPETSWLVPQNNWLRPLMSWSRPVSLAPLVAVTTGRPRSQLQPPLEKRRCRLLTAGHGSQKLQFKSILFLFLKFSCFLSCLHK